MSSLGNRYHLQEQKSEQDLKFFFISKGQQDVVKVIQYSFIQKIFDKSVYNLGFGDYDIVMDTIIDDVNTNNGDAFKVLNTVLSTIPLFFENYEGCVLMVQGSDGRPEFIEICRQKCVKKCKDECKNFNRRINIYSYYVNKSYEQLAVDYQFFGGLKNGEGYTVLEAYKVGKKYDSVLLVKRND
ncbi:hypothetical protein HB364_15600 [Pseudoflavitalea sp. X16]|uniref:DUF6934 family protein n=1 Tax=Paraflavitalea devenefica TaxID=2716334 RepID=UPI001420ED64|nr:hypothetical protein [Paraflavitalea devenefica]NII26514.1 hypothetical protein [Paraflavitalea devenefica]